MCRVIIGANFVLILSFILKLYDKENFFLMAAVTLKIRPRSSIFDLCQDLSKVYHCCKYVDLRCCLC